MCKAIIKIKSGGSTTDSCLSYSGWGSINSFHVSIIFTLRKNCMFINIFTFDNFHMFQDMLEIWEDEACMFDGMRLVWFCGKETLTSWVYQIVKQTEIKSWTWIKSYISLILPLVILYSLVSLCENFFQTTGQSSL